MVRALPFRTPTRLDFGRVLAFAAALALHLAALLLLLVPMAAPQLTPAAVDKKPIIRWIEREKKIEPTVVPIEEKQIVPQVEPKPTAPVKPQTAAPVTETPVIVEGGTEPAADLPAVESPTLPAGPVFSGPISASHLEYVSAPAPRYPVDAIRANATGTVVLRVLVDVDGTPLEVSIERSSGNKSLDREARQHVLKKWRFKPAVQDGAAVQAYGLVPIDFTLQ